jgi:hypothetical protein
MVGTSPRTWPFVASLTVGGALVVTLAAGASGRLAQSWHGLYHSAYVYQITNGLFPPTNPLQLEAPANCYWAWHLMLAAIVDLLQVTPFQANILVNAAALATTLATVWTTTGLYTRRPWVRWTVSLLPFSVLNPLAPLRFLWILATRGASELPLAEVCCLQPHPLLAARVGSLLAKFFNFGGFPVGVALFSASLLVLIRHRWPTHLRVVGATLLGLLAAFLHPTSAIAALFMAGAALAAVAYEHAAHRPKRWRSLLRDALPPVSLILGALMAWPYWASMAAGADPRGLPNDPIQWAQDAFKLGWVFLPVAPAYAIGLYRYRHLTRPSRLLVAIGIALALATLFMSLPERNQYKFALLSSLPSALLLLALLDELLPGWRGTTGAGARVRARIVGITLAVSVSSILANLALYRLSDRAGMEPWVWDQEHTNLAVQADPTRAHLQEAYLWLRRRTPSTAYVLERPVGMNDLEMSTVAERRTVVAQSSMYTATLAYHDVLVDRATQVVERLGACTLTQGDITRLFATPIPWPRSLYAIVPVSPAARGGCPSLPHGVEPVFDNPDYAIYVIRVSDR